MVLSAAAGDCPSTINNMIANGKSCCCTAKSCCKTFWCQIYGITIRSIPVVIAQLVGWVLFSYVEDDLNVIDCVVNRNRVIEKTFPDTDEVQQITELYERLANQTGQTLSNNQSNEIYALFKEYFDIPDVENLEENRKVFLGCIRWFRFAVMTMTTIGFGEITPKKNIGKMLVIPYALITIPLMLSLLTFVGAVISLWTENAINCLHKLIRGDKELRHKFAMKFFCLFVILLLAMLSLLTDIALEFHVSGVTATAVLHGVYFAFVTFTTIGYGDLTYFASGFSLYSYHLLFGLSAVSGLSNILIEVVEKAKCHRNSGTKRCCCTYVDNEATAETVPERNGAVEIEA